LKKVASDAALAVEQAFAEDLLAKTQNAAHAGIADILNRLEKAQSEEMLKSLAEVRPDDAKALKGMMFSFIELARVPERGRTMLLDQVPIERLVMALRGTDAAFQATILSSLAARSRRMVEAELSGGAPATDRDIAAARREIVDLVLKMIAKGEIVMPATDEVVDEITV
jgi:flagellar motor switch protein FliG